MTTDEVLKVLDSNDGEECWDIWDFIDNKDSDFEEVGWEYCNPRRSVLGIQKTYLNKLDDRYFTMELLSTENETTLYGFWESIQKTTTIYVAK